MTDQRTPIVIVDVEGGTADYESLGVPSAYVVVIDWDVFQNEDGVYDDNADALESVIDELYEALRFAHVDDRASIIGRIEQLRALKEKKA